MESRYNPDMQPLSIVVYSSFLSVMAKCDVMACSDAETANLVVNRTLVRIEQLLPALPKRPPPPCCSGGPRSNETTSGAKTDITPLMCLARIAFTKPSINSQMAASFCVLYSSLVIGFCGPNAALRTLASLGLHDEAIPSVTRQRITCNSKLHTSHSLPNVMMIESRSAVSF